MIEAHGTVVALSGDRLRVRVDPARGGCGRCNEPGGCGATRISDLFGSARNEFEIENSIDARSGDEVILCISEGQSLKSALVAYGLPVGLVIVGAAVGTAIAASGAEDLWALVGAASGVVLAFPVGRWLRRRAGWHSGIELRSAAGGKACSH